MADAAWLDLSAAAAYLSIRPDLFLARVRAGIIPAPSIVLGARTPRWYSADLDKTMAGGTGSTNAQEAVDALAREIATEGRPHRSSHPQGRHR